MKTVSTINTAPRLPNWTAAAATMRRGAPPEHVLRDLLGVDTVLVDDELEAAIISALAAQRAPAISIYDRRYTAHIYPEPGVADGQVYEALRDYAAQHATPDPAMVEIKRREIVRMVDEWKGGGPPSAKDDAYWRNFHAELARTKSGEDTENARDAPVATAKSSAPSEALFQHPVWRKD